MCRHRTRITSAWAATDVGKVSLSRGAVERVIPPTSKATAMPTATAAMSSIASAASGLRRGRTMARHWRRDGSRPLVAGADVKHGPR